MRFFFLHLLLLTSFIGVGQTVRYVSTTGTNNNPASATSWATSTGDLQGAIVASLPGDQVWVASGIYRPTTTTGSTSRTGSFTLTEGVSIFGGFTGTETALNQRPSVNPNAGSPTVGTPTGTTLSGDIGIIGDDSDNSYHVVCNPVGLTNATVLDGFVITAGNANGTGLNARGGGMDNAPDYSSFTPATCSPTIRNCLFYRNKAVRGGGIAIVAENSSRLDVSPSLSNCRFLENSATTSGAVYHGNFAFASPNPVCTDCTFESNTAVSGGVVTCASSGSFVSKITFVNSTFRRNTATSSGGVSVSSAGKLSATVRFVNAAFEENTAAYGGVFYSLNDNFSSGNGSFTNCSFRANSASLRGGLIYVWSDASFEKELAFLRNCLIWSNGGSDTFFQGGRGRVSVNYSLLEPSVTNFNNGTGNLITTTSPFSSTSSVQLATCSAAVNIADVASYTAANGPATDLAGKPRFRNGLLDMGAYQADFSGANGMVSVQAGNWNDVATWSCGNRLPFPGENIGIRHTVTLPSNFTGSVGQTTYSNGGQLLFNTGAKVQVGQ